MVPMVPSLPLHREKVLTCMESFTFEQNLAKINSHEVKQNLDTEPLLRNTEENSKTNEKKPFRRKFKRAVEKVIKFAERNLALSESRKSDSKSIAVDKIGSTEEFCDQVRYLGVNFDLS